MIGILRCNLQNYTHMKGIYEGIELSNIRLQMLKTWLLHSAAQMIITPNHGHPSKDIYM